MMMKRGVIENATGYYARCRPILLLQSLATAAVCVCLLTSLRVAFFSGGGHMWQYDEREDAVTAASLLYGSGTRSGGAALLYGIGNGGDGHGGNKNTTRIKRFDEIKDEIAAAASTIRTNYDTTYNAATVVTNSTTWFVPRKICQGTCCAETVAVSLRPDDYHIINTLDGLDLADVRLQHYRNPPHVRFAGDILNEAMLPCLQPGTIIHLDNHNKIVEYFFRKVREKISVPFVLLTTESDGNSPFRQQWLGGKGKDELLLRWYGTNPKVVPTSMDPTGKFQPLPLGLSKHHPQDKYLSAYLQATNYTNPFLDKSRWTSRLSEAAHGGHRRNVTVDDIFVKFGVNRLSQRRKVIIDALCDNRTSSGDGAGAAAAADKEEEGGRQRQQKISCGTGKAPPGDIYAEASTYLFGASPPGAGYDCYRTYELLLLGVIPIVEARHPISDELFRDLPVVQMENMFDESPEARGKYIKAARDYIDSDAFRSGDFRRGWERLFLRYWRRRILAEAGRLGDIVKDERGEEYYQVWKYTPTHTEAVLCSEPDNCKFD